MTNGLMSVSCVIVSGLGLGGGGASQDESPRPNFSDWMPRGDSSASPFMKAASSLRQRSTIMFGLQPESKTVWPSGPRRDRKSTRLNSSHDQISYAVFCLKKKKNQTQRNTNREST